MTGVITCVLATEPKFRHSRNGLCGKITAFLCACLLHFPPYRYLSAWTLMGHEYMELRNTAAAVQCYRNAVAISEV